MKTAKRILCVLCIMMLLANILAANASGNDNISTGTMNSSRIPILALAPGDGDKQVGYGGSEQFGYTHNGQN